MRTALTCAFAILLLPAGLTAVAFAQKSALDESLRHREESDWQAALDIWKWAEPGYREEKSSARLARLLEDAGFRVERKVAGMPTAFIATFGSGAPVIGLLGEYDALPGLSQQAVPWRQPREETWPRPRRPSRWPSRFAPAR
jgi:aminobenzoyl-glutamate utilization protein B